MAELNAAVEEATAGAGADDPDSTERPPSRREDLLQNAYFDVERGAWVRRSVRRVIRLAEGLD